MSRVAGCFTCGGSRDLVVFHRRRVGQAAHEELPGRRPWVRGLTEALVRRALVSCEHRRRDGNVVARGRVDYVVLSHDLLSGLDRSHPKEAEGVPHVARRVLHDALVESPKLLEMKAKILRSDHARQPAAEELLRRVGLLEGRHGRLRRHQILRTSKLHLQRGGEGTQTSFRRPHSGRRAGNGVARERWCEKVFLGPRMASAGGYRSGVLGRTGRTSADVEAQRSSVEIEESRVPPQPKGL